MAQNFENDLLLNALLVKPKMYPQKIQISHTLENLQAAVGGTIEATYPFDDPVALIVNDEGKLNGSEWNRFLLDDTGQPYDIIAGNFLVVGLGEYDFCSLSPALMEKYEKLFHQPYTFFRQEGHISIVPLPDRYINNRPESFADRLNDATVKAQDRNAGHAAPDPQRTDPAR